MAFSYRDLFFGGTKFCCCIPVRVGVIVLSVLGILFSGLLSIVIWYQVAVGKSMSPGIMAAFVISGLVETFLLAASVFGLVGAVVRKQTFVQIYAIITYIHFLLNLGVAVWLFVEISQITKKDIGPTCTISKNPDVQKQCETALSLGPVIYFVIATLVLLIEIYGAIILTRYVNQLKREKMTVRQSRAGIEDAFRLRAIKAQYSALASSHDMASMGTPTAYEYDGPEFDPYQEAAITPPIPPVQVPRRFKTFVDVGRPSPPIEVGYGGGSWTHEEISEEEKARLQRAERELGIDVGPPLLDEAEVAQRRSEIKAVGGPTTSYVAEVEELPRYTTHSVGEERNPYLG